MTTTHRISHAWRMAIALILAVVASGQTTLRAAREHKFIMFGYCFERNDSTGWEAIDSVEVSLTRSDTIVVPFKLLSEAGKSGLSKSDLRMLVDGPRDLYQLRLYKPGYEPILREVRYSAADRDMVYAENLELKREKVVALDGVEIKATAIKMVMKGDTIVYNASAFQLDEGSMLESLVAMFPGAEISPEGQIKVNGRVLNELLINGKDFFKGDPNVALKNLPSYTVDKVKVYDKAADDAYLTKSDVKLSRKEDEENLVMDVVLKKEFNTGMMANVEAGYGLNGRYQGRLFGLMFTDRLRISGFGNFNNVKDTGSASTDGYWRDGWSNPGELDVQMGGLDMLYSHGKWEVTASASASRKDSRCTTESANVSYYDTGDIYSRSDSREKNISKSAQAQADAEYKGESFYLHLSPGVSYYSLKGTSLSRSANFTRQPEEASRTESLDSLFAGVLQPSRFERWLLNRNSTATVSNPRNLNAFVNAWMTIRPEWMSGKLDVRINGLHDRNDNDSRTVYDQTLGPESTENAVPVRRDQYRELPVRRTAYGGVISYSYDKNTFTEEHRRTWSVYSSVGFDHDDRSNNYDYWVATGSDPDAYFSQSVVLPSLTRPENSVIDETNTYSTRYEANDLSAYVQGGWNISHIAETDSGINPSFGVMVSLQEKYLHHRGRRASAAESLSHLQRVNYLTPGISLSFSSANKKRYVYAMLRYRMSNSTPDVFSYIPSVTDADPFNVVERGMEDLKTASTHSISAHFGSYGRKGHMTGVQINGGINFTENAIGVARRFDPATGISYTRSVNVSGNRDAYAHSNVWFDFGKDNKWNWSNYFGGTFTRSADFVTATSGQPVKSLVNSANLREVMSLAWSFGKGSRINLSGNVGWNGARSPREDFNDVNVWNYGASSSVTLRLPLDFELRTSLSFTANRGYESSALNTDVWYWDASASKSILKGDLTFKLTAVDILNQTNTTSVHVNAQGRYETWTNTTPSYAMLSVIYRFRHTPKKADFTPDNVF